MWNILLDGDGDGDGDGDDVGDGDDDDDFYRKLSIPIRIFTSNIVPTLVVPSEAKTNTSCTK